MSDTIETLQYLKNFPDRLDDVINKIIKRAPELLAAGVCSMTVDGLSINLYTEAPGRPSFTAPAPTGTKSTSAKGMTFGEALEVIKAGGRVQRTGWNGKGMWIAVTPGSAIHSDQARAGAAQHLAAERERGPDTDTDAMDISPHIDMRAADGSLVIGWLASQTDMLANDWQEA